MDRFQKFWRLASINLQCLLILFKLKAWNGPKILSNKGCVPMYRLFWHQRRHSQDVLVSFREISNNTLDQENIMCNCALLDSRISQSGTFFFRYSTSLAFVLDRFCRTVERLRTAWSSSTNSLSHLTPRLVWKPA